MNKKPFLGTDLKLDFLSEPGMCEDVELAAAHRLKGVISRFTPSKKMRKQRDFLDLELTTGVENIIQSLVNRLKTRKGELAALGHPEYGSRHHELIGELNNETNRSLLKLYILEALSHEHRIESILNSEVRISPTDRTRVDFHLEIKIISTAEPISLVVPFYFEREGRL